MDLIRGYTKHFNRHLLGLFVLLTLGPFNYGMENHGFATIIAMDGFVNRFGDLDANGKRTIEPYFLSLLNSLHYVGFAGGLIIGSMVSNRWGRKRCTLIMSVYEFIPVIICLTARHKVQILIGRIVNYIYVGMVLALVPVYQAEIAPTPLRGFFVCTYLLSLLIGGTIMQIICWATANLEGDKCWMIPVGLFCVVPAILSVTVWFVEESPVWLLLNGETEKARDALAKLRTGDSTEEFSRMLTFDKTSSRYIELFRGTNLQRTMIAIMVNFFLQFSGLIFQIQLSPVFLKRIGVDPFLISIISGCLSILGVIVCLFLVDRIGRKPLLYVSASGNSLGMFVMAVLGTISGNTFTSGQKSGVVACLLFVQFVFQTGWGPLNQLITAEIPTSRLRDKTQRTGQLVTIIGSFINGFCGPYMMYEPGNWNAQIGYFYGAFSFLAVLYAVFFIPECKNKRLEELDNLFESKTPISYFQSADTLRSN